VGIVDVCHRVLTKPFLLPCKRGDSWMSVHYECFLFQQYDLGGCYKFTWANDYGWPFRENRHQSIHPKYDWRNVASSTETIKFNDMTICKVIAVRILLRAWGVDSKEFPHLSKQDYRIPLLLTDYSLCHVNRRHGAVFVIQIHRFFLFRIFSDSTKSTWPNPSSEGKIFSLSIINVCGTVPTIKWR
jgi:hypothetical protein